jgi:hypothetical protein
LCAHNSYYTANRCITQAKPLFIPTAKAGGFSAHLVIKKVERLD